MRQEVKAMKDSIKSLQDETQKSRHDQREELKEESKRRNEEIRSAKSSIKEDTTKEIEKFKENMELKYQLEQAGLISSIQSEFTAMTERMDTLGINTENHLIRHEEWQKKAEPAIETVIADLDQTKVDTRQIAQVHHYGISS